jgi:hypothetical protein
MHWWTCHSLVYLSIHHITSMILGLVFLVLIDQKSIMSESPFLEGMLLTLRKCMVLQVHPHTMALSLGEMERSRVRRHLSSAWRQNLDPSSQFYLITLFLHSYPCRSKHKEIKHNIHMIKDVLYSLLYFLQFTMPMLSTCWVFGCTPRGFVSGIMQWCFPKKKEGHSSHGCSLTNYHHLSIHLAISG